MFHQDSLLRQPKPPIPLPTYLTDNMTEGITRTVTESGGSLKVVIPKQLAQLYGIGSGDTVEWTQGGPGELRIRKVEEDSSRSLTRT